MVEPEIDDENRQAQFWRQRPDGFTVHEKSAPGDLAVTQGIKKLFKDTQWTAE